MVREISLIIPCQNAEIKVHKLLRSIQSWEIIPNEIILVDSSKNELSTPKDIKTFVKKFNIKLLIIHEKDLYPGHARNIGIKNSTKPSNEWLSSGLSIIKAQNSKGVWGSTFYQADTYTSKIFRACTFGVKPIKTFPGSILNKSIFNICGLFIETTRAGGDGDWMSRADLQRINISSPKEFLEYDQLNFMNITKLIKKWFRNYIHTAKLPFFSAHKSYYYYGVSFMAVLVAYNWNRVLAAWDRESIFFIPNITTISIISILIIYILMRGIILPRKKGVSIRFIFPINFIFIFLLSALLDLTKALAFAYSKFNKYIFLDSY